MRGTASAIALGILLAGTAAGAPDPNGAAIPPGWWEQVQSQVADAEYEVSWQTEPLIQGLDPAWQAPNRAHGFRSYFTPEGVRLIDRAVTEPTWELSLRLVRYGRGAQGSAVAQASIAASGSRVEYARSGLVEWYVNDRRGLEQGFELTLPPDVDEDGSVFLELELNGSLRPVLGIGGQSVEFKLPEGQTLLQYASLKVVDAAGRELPAWMELFSRPDGSGGLRLRFEDTEGVWPITVDPIVSTPLWTAESGQANANFGISVGTAGDVNGDGFSDIAVGAPFYDNGQAEEGVVFVFHGSAAGPSTVPDWIGEIGFANGWFGFSVAPAGDVTGDGFGDLIVGSPKHFGSEHLEGRAWAFHGSPTGLSVAFNWTVDSDHVGAQLGYSVSSAGDVNGDGISDVIIGAPFFDNGEQDEGRAFVYIGSPNGLAFEPAWTGESNQANANFGWAVGTAGDVDGNNSQEVIVGAPFFDGAETDEGRVFVYYGADEGLSVAPSFTVTENQANSWFGWSVSTAGDVDGDGYSDVIVGARNFTNGQAGEGAAYAYLGGSSGLLPPATWQVQSNSVGASLGWSVATAGDINGDGYADVIVGAPLYDNGQVDEGRVYVYEGSGGGLSTTPIFVNESDIQFSNFGRSVATAGDVDGDGMSDVIVGAPLLSNGQMEEGGAWVYRGSPRGPDSASGWAVAGGTSASQFAFSVAAAGDTNGDRFTDLVVGAPFWDPGLTDAGAAFLFSGSAQGPASVSSWSVPGEQAGAHFGWAVASAGDINGDGFEDIFVGAPEQSIGQAGEGKAYVFLGTETGVAVFPVWNAEGNQVGARFGFTVASAGDINGDGLSDLAVGAPQFDNGETDEGAVFVYHGTDLGAQASPAWTQDGDQAGASFGHDVASAGDIHGDGHSDLIVGAPLHDGTAVDAGRAYVYQGTVFGLITQPFWIGTPPGSGGRYGWSVDGAGDVNGDGWSEVIIGAPFFGNGQAQEGAAFLYSSTGDDLFPTPAWNVEGNQAQAWLGYSVAGAGDLNGDGFTDVLVGAPQFTNGQSAEGRATAYLGSGAGMSAVPAWTAEGDQATGDFGWEVAPAGDPNGDGYGDIVVGSPRRDVGLPDEGRASLYYGNGKGLDFTPQQRRFHNESPVAPLGVSDEPSVVRMQLRGKTPYGGEQVKIEWEVKPQGTPLDGNATGVSPFWLPSSPEAPVSFSPFQDNLTPGKRYHWQTRLLYLPGHSPWQQRSHWFRPPFNGSQELDLRLPATVDLVVDQTDSKDPVFVGESYTYDVEVLCQGFNDIEVSLQDQLPAGVVLVSAVPSQGECLEADHVITCFFGEVLAAQTVTASITVLPVVAGLKTNVMMGGAPASEFFAPNNQETIETTVKQPTIGNRVWDDLDGDGLQDPGEPGVGNVLVALYFETGALLQVVVTAFDGTYTLQPLNFAFNYYVRFFPPPGYVLTAANQGDDLSDSDPDVLSLQTPVVNLVEQDDLVRWDAGLIPFCSPPDEAIYIASMDVTDDGNQYAILNFQDPNQPSQITGYNVYRSSDPELPSASWPLIASDVVDMDESTANKQWVDSTGDEPPAGIWYYKVTAYNHRCPAEGPFQGE